MTRSEQLFYCGFTWKLFLRSKILLCYNTPKTSGRTSIRLLWCYDNIMTYFAQMSDVKILEKKENFPFLDREAKRRSTTAICHFPCIAPVPTAGLMECDNLQILCPARETPIPLRWPKSLARDRFISFDTWYVFVTRLWTSFFFAEPLSIETHSSTALPGVLYVVCQFGLSAQNPINIAHTSPCCDDLNLKVYDNL